MTSSTDLDNALPLDMIIFGGMGDLAMRKLLPALYMAYLHGNLPPQTRIISTGRQEFDRDAYLRFVEDNSRSFIASANFNDKTWDGFLQLLGYVRLDVQAAPDFTTLANAAHPGAQRVFYLSTSPSLFTTICAKLAAAGLVDANARVVLEKPLGHDLDSAIEINEAVGKHFAESQIYRIDHYLGKETVQNLMVLRFGNSILEPLWRAPNISSVQITVAEEVGVGSRAGFYDSTGAMRDMVQNHLLQLLCMVAMEPPASLSEDAIRDEKIKILKALKPIQPQDVAEKTVRGQYRSGAIAGKPVVGYLEEQGIAPDSHTETFVAIKAEIANWRWEGVPFYLRTGKRMQSRVAEIVVHFRDVPHAIFPKPLGLSPQNRLVIRLQPEESIRLYFLVKQAGDTLELTPTSLDLDFANSFKTRRAGAYERLLLDVIRGRLGLFVRRDEQVQAWRWVEPIIDTWDASTVPPKQYTAGTWGPAASTALMSRDGALWHEEV